MEKAETSVGLLRDELRLRNAELSGLNKQMRILGSQRDELRTRTAEMEREQATRLRDLRRAIAADSVVRNVHGWRILEVVKKTTTTTTTTSQRAHEEENGELELVSRVRVLERMLVDRGLRLEQARTKFEEKDRLFEQIRTYLGRRVVELEACSGSVVVDLRRQIELKNRKIKVGFSLFVVVNIRVYNISKYVLVILSGTDCRKQTQLAIETSRMRATFIRQVLDEKLISVKFSFDLFHYDLIFST